LIQQPKISIDHAEHIEERVVQTANLKQNLALQLTAKRNQKRHALLEQLRAFRGRLASDFKFDRDEANSR
jgi:hypothetical protein